MMTSVINEYSRSRTQSVNRTFSKLLGIKKMRTQSIRIGIGNHSGDRFLSFEIPQLQIGIEVVEWNVGSPTLHRIPVVLYEPNVEFSSCFDHVRSRPHSQLAKAAVGIYHHHAVSSCIFLIS